jgi:hypothetical protein
VTVVLPVVETGPEALLRMSELTVSDDGEFVRYSTVTFSGKVTETLEDATTIAVLDADMKRTVRVWVTEDFAVRTKGATYTNAEALKVGDTVLVKVTRSVEMLHPTLLWAYQRMFTGPVAEEHRAFPDLTAREWAALAPCAVLTLVIGVYPALITRIVGHIAGRKTRARSAS